MITLLKFFTLRYAVRKYPEMLNGEAALAAVNEIIAEYKSWETVPA